VKAGEKAKRNVQSELSCWIDKDMVVVYVRVGAIFYQHHLVRVELMESEGKSRGSEKEYLQEGTP